MAKANTRTNTRPAQQQQQAASPQKANEVAVIQPPRLPFHPAVQERFGVDRAGWKVLCESIFPAAKTPDSIILALSYCKARRLDPFKRNIHIVPIYDSKKREEVETVWPGIAELRTTAMRTKGYAGMDEPKFGPMLTRQFRDSQKDGNNYTDTETEVTFPEWCRITVYRNVQGERVPFPGPTVYWLEFYNKKSRFVDAPNEQWRRRPSQMLEKCAEAGALRRAFPEEFGEEYTVEEIGAFGSLATSARAVDAEVVKTTTPAAEPRRADFTEGAPATGRGGEPDGPQGDDGPGGDAPGGDGEGGPAPDRDTGDGGGDGEGGGEPAGDHPKGSKGQDQDPPGAEPKPEANAWYPNEVGQENVVKALIALIKSDKVKTVADLEALEKANRERVAKFTQANRAAITVAMDDRREDLGGGQ